MEVEWEALEANLRILGVYGYAENGRKALLSNPLVVCGSDSSNDPGGVRGGSQVL